MNNDKKVPGEASVEYGEEKSKKDETKEMKEELEGDVEKNKELAKKKIDEYAEKATKEYFEQNKGKTTDKEEVRN